MSSIEAYPKKGEIEFVLRALALVQMYARPTPPSILLNRINSAFEIYTKPNLSTIIEY